MDSLTLTQLGEDLHMGRYTDANEHEMASAFLKKLYADDVGDDEVDHVLYTLNDELGGKGKTKVKVEDIWAFSALTVKSLPGYVTRDHPGMRQAVRIILQKGRFFYPGTPGEEYGSEDEENEDEEDEDEKPAPKCAKKEA